MAGNVFARIPTKGAIADHSQSFVGLSLSLSLSLSPCVSRTKEEVAKEENVSE